MLLGSNTLSSYLSNLCTETVSMIALKIVTYPVEYLNNIMYFSIGKSENQGYVFTLFNQVVMLKRKDVTR